MEYFFCSKIFVQKYVFLYEYADLLYTFSTLDRNLNFIEHTSQLGWKEWVVPFRTSLSHTENILLFINNFHILWWTSLSYLSEFCRDKRAMPLIVDPGLYLSTKKDIFWAAPRRTLPTAFKLFTGNFPFTFSLFLFFSLLMIHEVWFFKIFRLQYKLLYLSLLLALIFAQVVFAYKQKRAWKHLHTVAKWFGFQCLILWTL